MMRFVSGVFDGMDGATIYPIFSLLVFVVFFVLLFWWVFRLDNTTVEEIKNIPLND